MTRYERSRSAPTGVMFSSLLQVRSRRPAFKALTTLFFQFVIGTMEKKELNPQSKQPVSSHSPVPALRLICSVTIFLSVGADRIVFLS